MKATERGDFKRQDVTEVGSDEGGAVQTTTKAAEAT